MRDQGVGSWTARRARMSPGRVAVVHDGREWTYGLLHDRATRLAHVLAGLGVRRHDRVAYLGPNHPTFLEALFGTGRLGAVFVPLNWRLAAAELVYILRDCGARILLSGPDQSATAARLARTVGIPVLAAGELAAGESPSGDRYERALAAAGNRDLDEPVDPDDCCVILYTSGTTGRPKGAMLSHAAIAWNCYNMLLDVDLAGDEVTLVAAPMFHAAALNQTVLPTLLKGGRVVLVSSFDPDRMLESIARYRVTFLFGVPTMFLAMARAPGWAAADLSSVRSAICGGAPVPEAVITAYQRRGVAFLQGYGLTEAGPGVLFLRRDDSVRKAGTAGTATFFTDVRLVRPDGAAATAGEPGEILVQGPNLMTGYWNRPRDTATVLSADGWLRTGDIGIADADGYVTILDRARELIISGGENIYPAEVEDVLYGHPAVAECAVVGIPDEHWGEVGRAVVVPRPGAEIDAAGLLAFLAGRIAAYKVPKSVVFTDALPRTAFGKIDKDELRAGGAAAGPS